MGEYVLKDQSKEKYIKGKMTGVYTKDSGNGSCWLEEVMDDMGIDYYIEPVYEWRSASKYDSKYYECDMIFIDNKDVELIQSVIDEYNSPESIAKEDFPDSNSDDLMDREEGLPQIKCPSCGEKIDFDYPNCPFCQAKIY